MKIHHFILIFLVFFFAMTLKTDLSIGQLKNLQNEKSELHRSLDTATSDAITFLAKADSYGTNSINKDKVVSNFFTSLYASLDMISDKNAQLELEMYIPVILLCDTDGYYVYYYDEFKASDGFTYTERKWSEKMPFYYRDANFVYRFTLTNMIYIYDSSHLLSSENVIVTDYKEIQTNPQYDTFRSQYSKSFLLNDEAFKLTRKGAILNQLEEVLAYYTSRHNTIAKQNGITYTFSFPSNKRGEWAGYIEDVNLTVVFQGYPYGRGRNYVFNKISSSGADVIKRKGYYVEKKGWYHLTHKQGCPLLAESIMVLEETFSSLEECAKIGAYCCECIENGSRVPDLNYIR